MSSPALALVRRGRQRKPGIGFSRVLTVLATMPAETLARIIEMSENETLHSPEQQALRAKRLNALKESL